MLSCNIDDMSGEIYSFLMETLLDAGALDVFYTPIQMKKNRPGVQLSVLCTSEKISMLEKIILCETTTFGIRKYPVERKILNRDFRVIETPYGQITVKMGFLDGVLIKATAEYEELKKISLSQDIPLIALYKKIQSIIEKVCF